MAGGDTYQLYLGGGHIPDDPTPAGHRGLLSDRSAMRLDAAVEASAASLVDGPMALAGTNRQLLFHMGSAFGRPLTGRLTVCESEESRRRGIERRKPGMRRLPTSGRPLLRVEFGSARDEELMDRRGCHCQ